MKNLHHFPKNTPTGYPDLEKTGALSYDILGMSWTYHMPVWGVRALPEHLYLSRTSNFDFHIILEPILQLINIALNLKLGYLRRCFNVKIDKTGLYLSSPTGHFGFDQVFI